MHVCCLLGCSFDQVAALLRQQPSELIPLSSAGSWRYVIQKVQARQAGLPWCPEICPTRGVQTTGEHAYALAAGKRLVQKVAQYRGWPSAAFLL